MEQRKLQKIIVELKKIINSLNSFEEEEQGLNTILKKLENGDENSTTEERVKHEIWEYYRKYKLKEFILKFYSRIHVETKTVDKNSFKTVDMINNVFCWDITNAGEGNNKKYNQKYYSQSVLDKEVKDLFKKNDKGSFEIGTNSSCKTYLLRTYLGEKIKHNGEMKKVEYKRKAESTIDFNNYLENQYYNKYDSEKTKTTIGKVISKIDDKLEIQNFIHSMAQISGMGIQLDHVMQRELIKKIVEKLCGELINKESDENKIIEQINKEINFLYPLMFGCVVIKEENSALKRFPPPLTQHYFGQLDNDKKEELKEKFNCKSDETLYETKGKEIAETLFWTLWENKDEAKIRELLFMNYRYASIELNGFINGNNKLEKIENF